MAWDAFQNSYFHDAGLNFSLDLSQMAIPDDWWCAQGDAFAEAFAAMDALEKGAIANPDENRMVGHYWLRNPELAPTPELTKDIQNTLTAVKNLAQQVHRGDLVGTGGRFEHLLVIGIGGSALGPQFVAQALGQPGEDRMTVHFFDNTDPDGMDLALAHLRGQLDRTLAVVISKSGGTPETRNGMMEAAQAFMTEGVEFAKHAVAVTGVGSKLDQVAEADGWLMRLPMFDWVGGRTSEMAAVGLLPAALQGLDVDGMLAGAKAMDALTRRPDLSTNPAALLAAAWYHATNGKGEKDMVILPYKDRLALFSKYLQQLVMESLGKEKDLDGKVVHQGIAVYGNKGSTDQHAYVQQLREGVPNFFATFISVLREREGASPEVEEGATSGDFLHAFFLGTRRALAENGRPSLTITVESITAEVVGMLIALYERAVGLYATLVNINAYHQPGVEAGKKAAANFLSLQQKLLTFIQDEAEGPLDVTALAAAIGEADETDTVFLILQHLVANPSKGVTRNGKDPLKATYVAAPVG